MSAKPDTISLAPERSLNQSAVDAFIGSESDTEMLIDGFFSIVSESPGNIPAKTSKIPQRKKERRREMRKMWRLIGYIV